MVPVPHAILHRGMQVMKSQAGRHEGPDAGAAPASGAGLHLLFPLVLALAVVAPASVAGQLPELPTLEGMGVEYISRSGYFQLLLSGRLDIEGHHIANEWETPTDTLSGCDACHVRIAREMQEGEGFNETHRLRVFADLFLGDHLYSLVELRADRGRETYNSKTRGRVEQVFVRAVTGSGTEGIQVGRFASPFGSYAPRHLTDADPFLNAPLPYDYRTVMNRWRIAGAAAGFLRWKNNPQDVGLPGAPPVWETPYQWGALVFGRLGPLDLRAAAMNSAPSSHPNAWALGLKSVSWIFGVRWKPTASLELGASYDRGPWMWSELGPEVKVAPSPVLPHPDDWRDFDQELIAVDVAYLRGPVMIRAEVIRDRWEVPNVSGRPMDMGYTVEAQTDIVAGLWVAARAGLIDFRPLGDDDWDHDVRRYEGAIGYRLSRNLGLQLSGYRQRQAELAVGEGDTDFVGVRLWWAF
jgi:hypothetical protein